MTPYCHCKKQAKKRHDLRAEVEEPNMMITVKSKIEKGCIPLPKKVRIQDGTKVLVRIEPILQKKDKQRIIDELAGSWANDPSIKDIFRKINEDRHSDMGREVSFE